MQNLLEQLKKVLAEDERLVSEGEILKNKVNNQPRSRAARLVINDV